MLHSSNGADALIRLTTLGAARIHSGGTAFPDLPAQRLRFALLLYLAVEQDVSRDEVVAMFWPDRDTGRGKHALRQMLYELRQVLGENWIEVSRDRVTVRATVDAQEFEAAVEEGRFAAALDLYGGPFLLGFSLDNRSFEAWVDRRGGHLARLHRRLQREHIAALVAAGKADKALAAARKWVDLDPLDDEAAHTLIERLLGAGERTAALQFYDAYERQLAADLQVEPLEDTRALVAAVRSGEVAPPATHADADGVAEPTAPVVAARATHTAPVSGGDLASGAKQVDPRASTSDRRGPLKLWRAATRGQQSLAVAAVAILFIAGFNVRSSVSPDAAQPRGVSIAVLPFNDRSADGALGALAGSLSDGLVRGLSHSRGLSVISPNGVLQLRAQGTPDDRLGRILGADYLVGGSVNRYGKAWTMDVELLDGRTGEVVRSEVFERPWSETRNLVDDVVHAAGQFLRSELGTRLDLARVRAPTSSDEAWRLFVEARAIQAQTVTLLEAGATADALLALTRADSLFQRATTLDPAWVEPIVLRGWVAEKRAFIAGRLTRTPDEDARRALLDAALVHAEQAVAMALDHAGAYSLRGAVFHQLALLRSQPQQEVLALLGDAEVDLRRAIALDSFDQGAYRRLADLLFYTGEYGAAKVAAERAYRVDPYSAEAAGLTYQLFNTSFEAGQDREADGWCFQGRKQFPQEMIFVYCLLALHAWADGIDPQPGLLRLELEKFQQGDLRVQPGLMPRFETMIAAAWARAGQPDSAHAILDRVAATSSDQGALWMRASAYAALHEDAIALELLDDYLAVGGISAVRVAASRPFWKLNERAGIQRISMKDRSR